MAPERHNIIDMPRISLKPNSPEFSDPAARAPDARRCEMPGCVAHADHRAPRDRSLASHYWFCFEHVRDYNAAWDFFSGMSQREIEEHIIKSTLGDRPTWRYDTDVAAESILRKKIWQSYNNAEQEPEAEKPRNSWGVDRGSPEFEALAIMGLEPPLSLEGIKSRYKELVKKHHPDLNPGDRQAEELLKRINMSYTILKLAYEKFEKLPAKA